MENEKKDAMIASIEAVEAVKDFLSDMYSVSDLFETAANAGSILLEFVNIKQLCDEDVKMLAKLIDQHVMLANLMKQFEKKGGKYGLF